MRAIGCSTNRRQRSERALQRVSGGVAGFSWRRENRAMGMPKRASRKRQRVQPPLPLQRRQHGSHQRQVYEASNARCRYMLAINLRLGVFAERVLIPDQRRRPSGSSASIGGNSGIRAPDGFGAMPAGVTASAGCGFVMRQQRRQHDERQRVGILIAVEHVANRARCSASSTPAASKVSVEKPGQSGSAIVCLTASACNGASPR